MLPGKAAPKGATIASQLKRIEAEANKRGILNFNIDSSVTSSPVAERVSKPDFRKSRLIVFQKKFRMKIFCATWSLQENISYSE